MVKSTRPVLIFIFGLTLTWQALAQKNGKPQVKLVSVDSGWASNSVNAVSFRKNSLVTWKGIQYIAFYNKINEVTLGKRKLGSEQWTLQRTSFHGSATDAHNTISIMVDGDGYLHVAWNHHNTPLLYSKSISPGSLDLTLPFSMTGQDEQRVTYPEFYRMKNGNLLFLYRSGESGNGKLVMNEYDISSKAWTPLQSNLIDGEEKRNAYWQATIDHQGTIHISWVWRESPDVASNHDLCYARSKDNGRTWEKSTGEKYQLPITSSSAEYAWRIPQSSELINQTSMSADEKGYPVIATYWSEANQKIPQYQLVYLTNNGWQHLELKFRATSFSLSGAGTKRIPIARPQVLVTGSGKRATKLLIFRDEERGQKVSAAIVKNGKWRILDLTDMPTGAWEPTYDTELWKEKKTLHLFLQFVEQSDGEGHVKSTPSLVYVLEWENAVK